MEKLFHFFLCIYESIKDVLETWFDKEMSFKEKFVCSFIQIIISFIGLIAILKLWNIIK